MLPIFYHFTIVVPSMLLGTYKDLEMFYTFLPRTVSQCSLVTEGSTESSFGLRGLDFGLTCAVICGPYRHRCVLLLNLIQSLEFATSGL